MAHVTTEDRDASLPEFLAAHARHASDARLAADVIGGMSAALAVIYWQVPRWEVLLSIALCFLAFGAWGIADRELGERAGAQQRVLGSLKVIRVLAAIVGFASAAFLMMSVLAKLLGRIIS